MNIYKSFFDLAKELGSTKQLLTAAEFKKEDINAALQLMKENLPNYYLRIVSNTNWIQAKPR